MITVGHLFHDQFEQLILSEMRNIPMTMHEVNRYSMSIVSKPWNERSFQKSRKRAVE